MLRQVRRFMIASTEPTTHRKIALVFPGQGSQFVGMGQDIYKEYQIARETLDECEEVIKIPLKEIMFQGPQAVLTKTEHAQPAILCHSIALLRVLQKECGLDVKSCTYALGHSLGEYSALVATESLGLADAIALVHLRGKSMQQSITDKETTMKALIVNGDSLEEIEQLMPKITRSLPETEVCQISNINARSQVVLSGTAVGVDYACNVIQSKGLAGRPLPLPVSAPFHCSLMEPAAQIMEKALSKIEFKEPVIDVISNVTAKPFENAQVIPHMLKRQITETVQWYRSVQFAKDDFVFDWIPIGSSKVLANLLRKEFKHDVIRNVSTSLDVKQFNQ
ncbi:acyl transferase/acyl hydrolase/lysophospholipase [Gorgonomyces haynaldii]|nr:acyl transferase/acyl hydrolase/lysophospholipase [Gorgonomyces haynaldii]